MNLQAVKTILLIGYGNPGRLDDGLGPALAEALEGISDLPDVTIDADYQLTVEDAAAVAEHDIVVFADASVNCTEPFLFEQIEAKSSMSFSSHSVEPQAVLGLARDMFKAETQAFTLGIRGYEFNEFGQKLSDKAQKNLNEALEFIISKFKEWNRNPPHHLIPSHMIK